MALFNYINNKAENKTKAKTKTVKIIYVENKYLLFLDLICKSLKSIPRYTIPQIKVIGINLKSMLQPKG